MEPKGTVMRMPQWVEEAEARITDQDRELENLPFKEGDEDLGAVPEDLRELYFVRNVLLREAGEFFRAHREVCHDVDCTCEELNIGMIRHKKQFDCIDTFFWVSLDTLYDAYDFCIDIRNGWRVVMCLEEDTEDADELDEALTDVISRGMVVANLANLDMDQSRPN